MSDGIVIEIMSSDFVLWRCLHGGPLTRETVGRPAAHPQMDWERIGKRNISLLEKLTKVYGGYAVVARQDQTVVGSLRFYPKAVCAMPGAGAFCLQQIHPAGPVDDFASTELPPLEWLADKTLVVHCLASGACDGGVDGPYRRKGLGTAMAQHLIDWARPRGWSAIEANAYEDLPILYQYTGQAGRRFWEKLGFEVSATGTEPAFTNDSDFTRTMRTQAAERSIDVAAGTNAYTMRLELA